MTPLIVSDPNTAAIADWLRLFVAPGQIVELRALKVKPKYRGREVTVSGYYDHAHLDVMARDALKLTTRGVDSTPAPGVYFVINPIKPQLLARRANRYEIAEAGSLTTDQDIVSRRWILIDVDPVRVSSISASDQEKGYAEDVSLAVYQHLKEQGWAKPIVVDSGNGWHLYYRVELPVDDGGLVKSLLHALAARFDNDHAKIDTTVFNPSRISKLPGTKSRKGDDVSDRPHRWSVVWDIPDQINITPRDVIQQIVTKWQAEQPSGQAAKPSAITKDGKLHLNAKTFSNGPGKSVIERARLYLTKIPPAIAGQHGHDATFATACRLVKDFGLSPDEAFPLLAEWNQSCSPPWSESDLRHKLQCAADRPGEVGRLAQESHRSAGTSGDAIDADLMYELDDPHRLAGVFLERFCGANNERCWVRWNGQSYRWNSTCYDLVKADSLRAMLVNMIQQDFDADAIERIQAFEKKGDDAKGKPPTARKVSGQLINNTIEHLSAMTHVNPDTVLPSWLNNRPAGFDQRESVVAKNGIVNLRKFVSGDPEYLTAPTPDYFSTNCLPFNFDPDAGDPLEWLRFLNDLWPNDPESIQCLQEWMGLLLVPDTRHQKILMMVGPRRSGKGTIASVIQALVGEANAAAPTLAGLATQFGLWDLVGKQVAIIGDARLSPKTDLAVVTERLLSISGNDLLTIDRKQMAPLNTRLGARIVICTNEIPRLTDTSNALAGRFVILKMVNSFYGQEDKELFDRLSTELPAILLWAISGWLRLLENGRFTIPNSSQDITTQLESAASPVGAFVREKCDVRADFSVDSKLLFDEWITWCEADHRHPGTATAFGIALRSVVPDLSRIQRRMLGARCHEYLGIRLKSYETDPSELPQ